MISNIVAAIGLVFVIEGLLYAVLPGRIKTMMSVAESLPDDKLRVLGAVAVAIGVGIVWIARSVLLT